MWGHVGGFAIGIAAGVAFKRMVPLDADGIPVMRPWFIPEETFKESDEIT
jgi:hypothetical protein